MLIVVPVEVRVTAAIFKPKKDNWQAYRTINLLREALDGECEWYKCICPEAARALGKREKKWSKTTSNTC